jgi:hypothetical protein
VWGGMQIHIASTQLIILNVDNEMKYGEKDSKDTFKHLVQGSSVLPDQTDSYRFMQSLHNISTVREHMLH